MATLDDLYYPKMVTQIKKVIQTVYYKTNEIFKDSLFEHNTHEWRNDTYQKLIRVVKELEANREIYEGDVICSILNNPTSTIDSGLKIIDIKMKMGLSMEFIEIHIEQRKTGLHFYVTINRPYNVQDRRVTIDWTPKESTTQETEQ